MSDSQEEATKRVVGYALSVRQSDRGAAARLRAGLTPATEHRAFGDVLPLLPTDATAAEEKAYLRAAALIAAHPKLEPTEESRDSIGRSFRKLSVALAQKRKSPTPFAVDPSNPDGVASRLAQLPEQNLDAAALSFNRILGLGDDLAVPIDYFDLTRILLRWGGGATEASVAVRRRPLRDYYRYIATPTEKETP